jgi:hypothetical protein
MNCTDIREQFLEASATALAGHGESVVARHVRTCMACQALATRILDETEGLAADLGHLQPRMSEEEAVRVAREGRATVGGKAVADRGLPTRRRRRSGAVDSPDPRRGRWWAPVPVAAAAAIAALVLTAGPRGPGLEEIGPSGPSAFPGSEPTVAVESLAGLSVEVPVQGRVAVFETSDPSVTVVWFY